MALGDWAAAAAIATGVIASLLPALKNRSESRKYNADAAAVLGTSAGAVVTSMKDEMLALRTEAREFREWREGLERRLRRHARWDDQMVTAARGAGMTVPDPPVLFDDDEGAVAR